MTKLPQTTTPPPPPLSPPPPPNPVTKLANAEL